MGCEEGNTALILIALILSIVLNLLDRRQVWKRVRSNGYYPPAPPPDIHYTDRT